MIEGLVLKKNADKFDVLLGGEVHTIVARNLKKDGVFVGDRVMVDEATMAIGEVCKRKNLLIRPPMANLDSMIIVIAQKPKPDFLLVDKLLIFCVLNGIKPVLCVNKADLGEDFVNFVKENYQNITDLVVISTLDNSVEKIKKHISGITALAGQSAVGKSSIINALLGESKAVIGEFSKKVERGKQTTRIVELYMLGKDKFIADTTGFSKLDASLLELDERDLKRYYPEFLKYAEKCKYKSCVHLSDKDCGVVDALKQGKITELRYKNYVALYENLKSIKKF